MPPDKFLAGNGEGLERVPRLPTMTHSAVGFVQSLELFVAASTFKVSRLRVEGHEDDADRVKYE